MNIYLSENDYLSWEAHGVVSDVKKEFVMKRTGIYLAGYVILIGGLFAALWKMGVLSTIGTAWTFIVVVIAIGVGIMLVVTHSGSNENIEIGRK